MTEPKGDTVTIENLVATLTHIEEWTGLVKQALLRLDQQMRVPVDTTAARPGSVRLTRGMCEQVLAPTAWKALEK